MRSAEGKKKTEERRRGTRNEIAERKEEVRREGGREG